MLSFLRQLLLNHKLNCCVVSAIPEKAINEGSLVSKGHLCDSISMKKYIKEKSIENVFQGLGKFSDFLNFIAYFYVDSCESVCELVGVQRCQGRTSDPLEMELQAGVSHLKWVLGTELCSPSKRSKQVCLDAEPSLQAHRACFSHKTLQTMWE